MKRPTLALLSLLATLALGLVAAGPRSTEAGSLGQLAFAMQIEETAAGDPIVCPLVCCPFGEEMQQCEQMLQEEPSRDRLPCEAPAVPKQHAEEMQPRELADQHREMELNAAETADRSDADLADVSGDEFDYDHYYEDYGYEYGEEYQPAAESGDSGETNEDIELNPAETSDAETQKAEESLADEGFEEYYGDYAYDYTDFGSDYIAAPPEEAAAPAGEEDCNDLTRCPTSSPSEASPETEAESPTDETNLAVDQSEGDATEDCVDPYDQYGRQVGDCEYDFYEEEFYEDTCPDTPAAHSAAAPAAAADEAGMPAAEQQPVSDAKAAEAEAVAEAETQSTDDYYEDYFYEDYYEDYYEELDESGYYEDDYERYYSEDYQTPKEDDHRDGAEANAVVNEPAGDEPADHEAYMSDYDALYDAAVYGEGIAASATETTQNYRDDTPSPPVVPEVAAIAEPIATTPIQEAYLAGKCIDEGNALPVDDLPWADEVETAEVSQRDAIADVAEIDVPEAADAERGAKGKVSEYGSDYAEEYYEEYFESLDAELAPLETRPEKAALPAASPDRHAPIAAAKTLRSKFDVSRLAAYCGRQVAEWTDTLSSLAGAIRTAAAEAQADATTR